MKIKYILFPAIAIIFSVSSILQAAGWQMKEMGVGIYDDAAYDTELRIVEKRNTWSMQELQQRGALAGRGKVFGAWLVGPPVNTYLNQNGVAEYLYKYRLTDPKGNSTLHGPHGFYTPGFTIISINAWITGNWKIDFQLWSRSTQQVTNIGSIEFTITDQDKVKQAAGWQMKDGGVGLYVYDPAKYDKELQIIEKRNTWSLKELQEKNAFSQASGRVFGAWLVGPPVDTYLNKNGVAEYLYKYRLTDPKGNASVFGPYGFYLPGFATIGINAWNVGKWKIDFMLWQRSTEQVTPISSIDFTIIE